MNAVWRPGGRKRHPLNTPGPFYVEDDCCTDCGIPEVTAPELFRYVDGHCFVSKQPESQEDLDDMTRTMHGQEFDCIRYDGKSPRILELLSDAGLGDLCDHLDGGPDD